MKKHNNRILTALMIGATALIVSGCGGGGGGSSSAAPIAALGSTTVERSATRGFHDNLVASSESAGNLITELVNLSLSDVPTASGNSITQSSGTATTTVTTEADSLTIEMGGLVTVQSDTTPSARVRGSQDYTVYYLSESHDGSDSSNTDPPVVEAVAYTTKESDTDTDYTTFGYWLYSGNRDYSTGNPEIAAFAYASGAVTPNSYLRPTTAVTATYRGDAVAAAYLPTESHLLFGTVELTATFDSSPTVQGRITDMDTSVEVVNSLGIGTGFTLAEASLADAPGGYFTESLNGASYAGNWGGHFHGDEAERVTGTFDAFSSGANTWRIIGSFGAKKETPTE